MKNKNYRLPALPKLPPAAKSTTKAPPPRGAGVAKAAAFSSKKITPVSFGRPPQSSTKSSQSGSQWSNLLTQTTSSGLAGAFSSAAGFGGGIGSIISGFASLFGGGGKSAPPALVEYQMPASQQQLVTIGSPTQAAGNYAGPQPASPFEQTSAHIVQAVKQALLNSSSLNDIIAEI